ncbi:hypothetical protein ElP_05170 [Tautonia plasticadhaerens]|uniref:Uncharacterized protein n=1 Tax=Tautonia plasticadhaerens TaxID=2527974 RepID=A0A518GVR4_9BACT|nr:hypothetical protein ElP_05170 [Tautonia plasticadhaerens]
MSTTRLFAIATVIGIGGAALALAQQGLPDDPPFDLAPDPHVESPFGEFPLDAGASPSPRDSVGDVGPPPPPFPVDQADPPLVADPAPGFEVGVPDSRAYIDQGVAQAERAIEALSDERARLRSRIEKIEAELARWEAVNRGLLAARQARPASAPDPVLPPSSIDPPELEPLTSRLEGVALPPSEDPGPIVLPRSDSAAHPPRPGFEED